MVKDVIIHEDHQPTAIVDQNNTISFTTDDVIPVKELTKRPLIRDEPDDDERVVSLQEYKHYFENLEFADILLTNACNLACTYCYEQHNKDFGRYTPETIRKVWDWLRDINDFFPKYIQFFGGEPLIHKNLILKFMRDNADELERMKGKMVCSITTNGLLLTKEFVDEYFSYPGSMMMISLDTIRAEHDHRGIGQEKINKLLDMIEYVVSKADDPSKVLIRATIGREAAPYVNEFWEELYKRGVKQLVFHPLILSYGQGYLEWEEDEWNTFTNDIKNIIRSYPDIAHFQVAEGVGVKGKTNCMIGSDEIAVDPSGDFSGCYFFTNRKKSGTGKMLLGNIFSDEFYIDRHNSFVKAYDEMYENNEECKTCEVRNLCYQCPAGNLTDSGTLFRPDGMCKRFITLYGDCKELLTYNQFKNKVMYISNQMKEDPETLSRGFMHMLYQYVNKQPLNVDDCEDAVNDLGYKKVIQLFYNVIVNEESVEGLDAYDLVNAALIGYDENFNVTALDLYEVLLEDLGVDMEFTKTVDSDVVYYVLINLLVTSNHNITKEV